MWLVALALALIGHSRLFLDDEPTSALDPVSEAAIFKLLQVAAGGATMIVAAHRLAAVTDADLILVMSEGRIVESGRHEVLVAKSGLYAEMRSAQQTPIA